MWWSYLFFCRQRFSETITTIVSETFSWTWRERQTSVQRWREGAHVLPCFGVGALGAILSLTHLQVAFCRGQCIGSAGNTDWQVGPWANSLPSTKNEAMRRVQRRKETANRTVKASEDNKASAANTPLIMSTNKVKVIWKGIEWLLACRSDCDMSGNRSIDCAIDLLVIDKRQSMQDNALQWKSTSD